MFQKMQFNLNFQLEIIFAPKFEFEFLFLKLISNFEL